MPVQAAPVPVGKRFDRLSGRVGITLTDIGKFAPRYRDELWRGYCRVVEAHESNLRAHG